MDISLWCPGYFNGYFVVVSRIFQWIFHCGAQDISLWFSYEYLGYFNGYFIVVPRIFLCDFHMNRLFLWNCHMWGVGMVVTWPDTKNGQKMKVVALQCSFPNLFELYSEVLPSWRYDVKDFSECCVFFCFLHFSLWKQNQTTWFQHIMLPHHYFLTPCPSCLSHQEVLFCALPLIATGLSHNVVKFHMTFFILHGWWANWSLEEFLYSTPKSGHEVSWICCETGH